MQGSFYNVISKSLIPIMCSLFLTFQLAHIYTIYNNHCNLRVIVNLQKRNLIISIDHTFLNILFYQISRIWNERNIELLYYIITGGRYRQKNLRKMPNIAIGKKLLAILPPLFIILTPSPTFIILQK